MLNKTVLVDANFVISIVEAMSKQFDLNHVQWRQQLDAFTTYLSGFLDKCCMCPPSSQICTSDRILSSEINPTIRDSTIRRKSAFFRKVSNDYYSASRRFFSDIHTILLSRIRPITTDNAGLISIRTGLGNPPLSDEDLSLAMSALLESGGTTPVFIVTDDEDLRETLNSMIRLGSVALPTGSLASNFILPLSSYSYTSHIHQCCLLSNDDQLSFFGQLIARDMSRPLNDRKRRIKGSQIDEAFRVLRKAMNIKAARGY